MEEIQDSLIIIYKKNKNEDKIKLFGFDFIKNNKNHCKIIYDNKVHNLTEYINIEKIENKSNKTFEIKLTGINNISNAGSMFQFCSSLTSLPDISDWNTINITNLNEMFRGCSSLISLPDISNWNISNVTTMKFMFHYCKSLISLPDISKWNASNVNDMILCLMDVHL